MSVVKNGQKTYRSIQIQGDELEFSGGFAELHTKVYEDIINGNGYGLNDCKEAINIVSEIRNADLSAISGDFHPLVKKNKSKHPFKK